MAAQPEGTKQLCWEAWFKVTVKEMLKNPTKDDVLAEVHFEGVMEGLPGGSWGGMVVFLATKIFEILQKLPPEQKQLLFDTIMKKLESIVGRDKAEEISYFVSILLKLMPIIL